MAKRSCRAAIALGVLICSVAGAEPMAVPAGIANGTVYRGMSSANRQTYVAGLWDGLLSAQWFGGDATLVATLQLCPGRLMDAEQLTAIVDKYISDHPEAWQHQMSMLFLSAISATCPKYKAAYAEFNKHRPPASISPTVSP